MSDEQKEKINPLKNFRAKTNEEVRAMKEGQKLNEVTPEVEEIKKEETKKPDRKERIPFGGPRLKLSAPPREGKVRRWVNDTGGRCQQAELGGYEFVTDDGLKIGDTSVGSGNQSLSSRVSRVVGTKEDGSPLTAFLMEIDEEFYKEDQDAKNKKLDEIDAQILRGNVEGQVGRDGRYIPKEGIHYKP